MSKVSPFSRASWIVAPTVGAPRTRPPAPYLRKTFRLDREIRAAHLTITALGLYEAVINDRNIADHVLAPGWTDYDKRVSFQSHDVTSLLKEGENVFGVILGDGWYCGHVAWANRQLYGDRPRLVAQLDVDYTDGSHATIATDESWRTTNGPILENDLLAGESYDARLELSGWSKPGYDDSFWQAVQGVSAPDIAVTASLGPPVRPIQELGPILFQEVPDSWPEPGWLVDFGQNFIGRVRIKVRAARGITLTIRHAEMLGSDGTIYTENLRTAKATDYYTCRGDEVEVWEPRFTFHGFRYAFITGLKAGHALEVRGVVLHSAMASTGSFSCSHPLLNQLQSNIVWGQKSNFLEVPTDCPQRDERLGWTGDAQVFIRTACFNMDVRDFFRKWMQDIRDAQRENGGVPPVIPKTDFLNHPDPDGGPAWADATIICPWIIYLCYGDRTILQDHYDSMRRYMNYLASYRCRGFVRSHPDVDPWGGFGDWLALDGSGKNEGGTPRDLIGTAFYAYISEIMARVAAVLGHAEDASHFRALHGKIAEAFQYRFVTPEGLLASGTQTAYVLALHFGLLPENARETAARELVRDIQRRDFHLATGFVGTPYLLDVLEQNGYLDVAYKLLEQETFPSWLFPVKNGATTIWERWDGWTPEKGFQDKAMNSFNHYAYGAVGAWMYRSMAGLELDPEEPGYRHIIFRPRPGGSITWANAVLETVFGQIGIHWALDEEKLKVQLVIPPNTRATFDPPAGYECRDRDFAAGRHEIVLEKITV